VILDSGYAYWTLY